MGNDEIKGLRKEMGVEYKNRKGKTHYLHVGKTKTGKPKYYFSMKKDGELVDAMPEGYEIYEHPANAQVFLRKKLPQLITDLEKDIVERELKNVRNSTIRKVKNGPRFMLQSRSPEFSTKIHLNGAEPVESNPDN